MIIKLLDKNESEVASSFSEITNRNTRVISFVCTNPGKYWLKTQFDSNKPACCALMMGMLSK